MYRIKGEVECMDDGVVRISCEGDDDTLKKFIHAIQNVDEPAFVDDFEVNYTSVTGKYKAFRIIPGGIAYEIAEGTATMAMYLDSMSKTLSK